MFDIPNTKTIKIVKPLTDKNFINELDSLFDLKQLANFSDLDFLQYFLPSKNSTFSIKGNAEFFTPVLTSPSTINHLLYIQNLALLDMSSDYYTNRNSIDSYMFLYTFSGSGYVKTKERSFILQEGTGCIIDCSKPHTYHTHEDHWKHFVLHFNGPSASVLVQSCLRNGAFVFQDNNYPYVQSTLERLARHYTSISPTRDIEINYLLTKLVTDITILSKDLSITYENMENHSYIEDIITYMKDHLEQSITLNDLSIVAHRSKFYLSREFFKHTGFTPIDYLIYLRLERAKVLLHTTKFSIQEISYLVGYPNEQHFGKIFKARIGMSPSAYRKQI